MTEKQDNRSQTRKMFAAYWRCYGGWRAITASPYFIAALVITILLFPAWIRAEWWTTVIQILPNIVGFSIGGFAIWLGFGDEKFKALIAEKDFENDISPYMEVSATFTHFVLVQVAAILAAVGGAAFLDTDNSLSIVGYLASLGPAFATPAAVVQAVYGFFGFLLFTYAIGTAVAAVFAIFEVAGWFDKYKAVTIGVPGQKVNRPNATPDPAPAKASPPKSE